MTSLVKKISLVALLIAEGAISLIGFNIKREAEKYYDKREKVEISQQMTDYRIKLGNIMGYVGLGALLLTPTPQIIRKKERRDYN